MLYRLEAENFLSIRDRQVLDLTIAPNVPDPDTRYAPIFPGSELRAPKVVALYGKNASGKTNVLRALEFIVMLARAQQPQQGWPVAIDRFNDSACVNRPMKFAIELGGAMNLTPEVMTRIGEGAEVDWGVYRYELVLEVKDGLISRVQEESLRQRPNGQGKWQRVFERDVEGQVKGSHSFSISGFRHLLNTLGPTTSVLSSFAHFQHPAAQLFLRLISAVTFSSPMSLQFGDDRQLFEYLHKAPPMVAALNKDLGRIDMGIEGMRIAETAQGPQAAFKHSGLEAEMPWGLESHGTRKFIKVFPWIAGSLYSGGIAVIDELDTAIHPSVLPEILSWYYAPDRNPDDAQIWFTCHAASLLDDLNKEEIVICDKDDHGRTTFHSLMDVKLRRDDNFYRKYLSGALGGVPQIG